MNFKTCNNFKWKSTENIRRLIFLFGGGGGRGWHLVYRPAISFFFLGWGRGHRVRDLGVTTENFQTIW